MAHVSSLDASLKLLRVLETLAQEALNSWGVVEKYEELVGVQQHKCRERMGSYVGLGRVLASWSIVRSTPYQKKGHHECVSTLALQNSDQIIRVHDMCEDHSRSWFFS